MQKMKIQITAEDIRENERFRLNNPIVFVLQRMTGTLWQLDEDGLLAEAMTPFRACQLSRDVLEKYRYYRRTGKIEPFEFEVEFHYDAVSAEPVKSSEPVNTQVSTMTRERSHVAIR